MKMKKTIIALCIIVALTLVAGFTATASAKMLNPAQFPYSIFETPDLFYLGSNTGSEIGVPCGLEATYDNNIFAWFAAGIYPTSITPSSPYTHCIAILPSDPSEVVNTAEYLSSSQKNHIRVAVSNYMCEGLEILQEGSIKPANGGFYWSDHVPGLTTGTANPVVGISLVKLQDSAIAESAGPDYVTVADALSAAGFKLDKKGYWVNQCYGGPFLQTLEP